MTRDEIIKQLQALIQRLSTYLASKQAPKPPTVPQDAPKPIEPVPVPLTPKYAWTTPSEARHSVRLICDEEGLTVQQKNDLSKTVHCESGYHTQAVHPNLYNGKLASTDRGIAQWNDHYHGGEITNDEAFNDPEKAIRLMCKYVKRGQLKLWVCYSSGLYKQYSA